MGCTDFTVIPCHGEVGTPITSVCSLGVGSKLLYVR